MMPPRVVRFLLAYLLWVVLAYVAIAAWAYDDHWRWRQSVGWNDCSAAWMKGVPPCKS
jgi:hypothetical protein